MEPSTTDSGRREKDAEWEGKSGKMEPFTKAIGLMIWQTDRVDLFSQEETYTKDSGSTIKLKVREFISIKMEHHILENGIMTNNMAMVTKNGQTVLNTMETMWKV